MYYSQICFILQDFSNFMRIHYLTSKEKTVCSLRKHYITLTFLIFYILIGWIGISHHACPSKGKPVNTMNLTSQPIKLQSVVKVKAIQYATIIYITYAELQAQYISYFRQGLTKITQRHNIMHSPNNRTRKTFLRFPRLLRSLKRNKGNKRYLVVEVSSRQKIGSRKFLKKFQVSGREVRDKWCKSQETQILYPVLLLTSYKSLRSN